MFKHQSSKYILFILVITNSFICAQWNNDPVINNPLCIKDGTQDNPKIISDGFGGAIIAWQEYQFGTDIFAQKIDKNGYTKWLNNGRPISDLNGDQFNVDMVDDGEGGAIFVWQDGRDSIYKIYMDRIDSSGWHPWSDGGLVVCSLDVNQTLPKISKDGQGKFIITWIDTRSGINKMYAQKIDIEGTIIWNDYGAVATYDLGDVKDYKIKNDGWGGIYIIWEDSVFSSNKLIKAQYLTSAHNRVWGISSDLLITNGSFSAISPDMILFEENKIIITWSDNRTGVFNIYAQSINQNSTFNWEPNGNPVSSSSADEFNPQISRSTDGSSIIVWEDYRDPFPFIPPKIYAQKISYQGIKLWQSDDIFVQLSSMDQWSPKIIEDGFGGAHIVWTDFSSEFGNINEKSINTYGEFYKNESTIISQADLTQAIAGITSDGSNGLIAVWVDRRNNFDPDIYCAQMDANGNLGAGQGKLGLIADYPFDGNSNDISNNNNNGTVVNAVLTTDRFGNPESAYEFDGTAYISVASSNSLNSPKRELTQCAWVQITQWGWSGNTFVPIIMKSDVFNYNFQYRLAVSESYLITSINNWDNSAYANFTPQLNVWYFVATVLNNDSVASYVNGNLLSSYPIIPGPINYDAKPLEIGRDMPGAEEDFFGKIDDIKIYNRALSYEEIFNLYQFGSTTSIDNNNQILMTPNEFKLDQNYPNPFNPSTKISWKLPVSSHQTLKVYDVLGNEVSTLVDENKPAGSYEVEFKTSVANFQLASGIYFYRLQAGSFIETKKMILIK